eukprot:m.74541 g.74541  ORF g.74541 m.74541 type:complete len:411 (-) comp8059_c0_seq2:4180-5412(-)
MAAVRVVEAPLSADVFLHDFMAQNEPVMIRRGTAGWAAVTEWTLDDGSINLDAIVRQFGPECTVPVTCEEDPDVCEMTLGEFADYFRTPREQRTRSTYLKDWHFTTHPDGARMYKPPAPFAPDWLNAYCAQRGDDFRFVYLGPAGSRTLLHTDVLGSFSWSANISGKKRWTFFPPDQRTLLRSKRGHLLKDITSVDEKEYPHFSKAVPLVVLQEPGDLIFVPSFWYHQVENLTDALSINHNWGNACNIAWMYHALEDDLKLARKETDDCKDMEDWDSHCQLMLRANCGFDYSALLEMVILGVRHICLAAQQYGNCALPTWPELSTRMSLGAQALQNEHLSVPCNPSTCRDLEQVAQVLQGMLQTWTTHACAECLCAQCDGPSSLGVARALHRYVQDCILVMMGTRKPVNA